MAKIIAIELDKTISDIVARNFKLGTTGDKVASSILNGILNKMIFGDDAERKTLITMLVPDILSSTDALKLYNNIIKYKEKEKEQLAELMSGELLKKNNVKKTIQRNTSETNNDAEKSSMKEQVQSTQNPSSSTHQAIAFDNDL